MADIDLLVIGDANPDLVLAGKDLSPRFGQQEVPVDSATLSLGGSAAITAAGASSLGIKTAFAGIAGNDLFGRFVLTALAEAGVDVGGCLVREEQPTGVSVVLSQGDDRATLTSPGCTFSLGPEDIDRGLLRSARHVHTSMYFFFSRLKPALAALFAEARASGLTTSLDPHGDPAGKWNSGIRQVLGSVDVFLPNAKEACGIAGVGDPERAARLLASEGATVVVKLGPEGAILVEGDSLIEAPALRADAADTTGAGDSFDAGFLAGRLMGLPNDRALLLAVACGSLSTRAAGGTGSQPSLAEATLALEGMRVTGDRGEES